jgi:hypothetical protein
MLIHSYVKSRSSNNEIIKDGRQWFDKRVSVVTDTRTTVEEVLEPVFSMWSLPSLYSEGQRES